MKDQQIALCSIIVHLHLNRPQCSRHPAVPKTAGQTPLAVLGDIPAEHVSKRVVDIEARRIVHFGNDQLLIQRGRDLIGLLAQAGGQRAHLVAVEVDGGHLLQVAAVADLVASLQQKMRFPKFPTLMHHFHMKLTL